MKALVCKMCDGKDLVLEDGFFVCQNCGTKYSPDTSSVQESETLLDQARKTAGKRSVGGVILSEQRFAQIMDASKGKDGKIHAIKLVREYTGLDLRSAKEYVERAVMADDPTYVPPQSASPSVRQAAAPKSESELNKSGGCYVATAVYGSYDCPQVWTLRRFRDYELALTPPGRAFIRVYYAISPIMVRWFGNTSWFQRACQGPLDRLVARCQTRGHASTPYEDRNW